LATVNPSCCIVPNLPEPLPLKLHPACPLATAARILGTNPSTLRAWFHGRNYPTKAGRRHAAPVMDATQKAGAPLSFIDLLEAYMLLAIRRGYGIPLRRLRDAMDYLRTSGGNLLFLAHRDFKHDNQHLNVTGDKYLVLLSERGQHVEPEIIREGLRQLMYGEDGYADRFFPLFNGQEQKTIMLSPGIGFGRPVLAKLGVSAEAVAERFRAGEHLAELAADYGATPGEIEDAIRWSDRRVA
jgi:uncharacterized protein (DUF433 family)